jgi:hypothetical protein
MDLIPRIFEIKAGARRVRTAAGARKYGQPIGSIIRTDPLNRAADLNIAMNPVKWVDQQVKPGPLWKASFNASDGTRSSARIIEYTDNFPLDEEYGRTDPNLKFGLTLRDDHDELAQVRAYYRTMSEAKAAYEKYRQRLAARDKMKKNNTLRRPAFGVTKTPSGRNLWQHNDSRFLARISVFNGSKLNGGTPGTDRYRLSIYDNVTKQNVEASYYNDPASAIQKAAEVFERFPLTPTKREIPESKKRFVDQENWGIYGRDWSYGDDSESKLPQWDENDIKARMKWAEHGIRELGVEVHKQKLDPRYTEVVANYWQHLDAEFPGFMPMILSFGGSGQYRTANGYNSRVWKNMKDYAPAWGEKLGSAIYLNSNKGFMGVGQRHNAGAEAVKSHGQGGLNFYSTRYEALKEKFPDYGDDQLAMLRTTVHETGHTVARIVFGELWSQKERNEKTVDDLNYYSRMFWAEAAQIMEDHGLGDAEGIRAQMGLDRRANTDKDGFKINKSIITSVLSEYGGTNLHEMLAEVWAEYQLDPEPRSFAARMGAVMETVMEEWVYWEELEPGEDEKQAA